MHRISQSSGLTVLALLCALALGSGSAAAQGAPPPIQGVTGTIATDGTIESEHKAGGAIARGAAHVATATKKLFSFGSKGAAQDALDALAEGSRVVVQEETAETAETAATAEEGVVIDVNRRRQQITVRFADKKTETLRVLDRTGADQGAHVLVSLADRPGEKVAYDFTRVP
jgi:hypothetical protein